MNAVNNPEHYNKGVSPIARPALRALGFEDEDFALPCIDAIEQTQPWLTENSYAMTAAIYLWRMEYKDNASEDLGKAKWWLLRGINFCGAPFTIFPAGQIWAMSDCMNELEAIAYE